MVRTLEGDFAPPGGRPVDLVFRSVGERTSELALDLAIRHLSPNRVHVIENVKPFSRAVARMLELEHRASHIVYVDADCLILEDLRPFLDGNELPYVDCYVRDRFRGRIHCGVHITRIDVVRAMRDLPVPQDDLAYVLRPESRLRNLALRKLGANKQLKGFHILHDYMQHFGDIFTKYALRELRSRTARQRPRLEASMARWGSGGDFDVARAAVRHAARAVPASAGPLRVEAYIRDLPRIAPRELAKMGLTDRPSLTAEEVTESIWEDAETLGRPGMRPKVFGLGLSRTGTRSLTAALHQLGFHTVHYPTDRASLEAMARGDGRFPLLEHYDGLTDITTIPFLTELDALHPGARFVLTVREREGWLHSCENHWRTSPAFELPQDEEHATHMEVRRFLRTAVYGSYEFDRSRFARVYDEHVARVCAYFGERPRDLLVLDVCAGEGWEKLAPFLGCAPPDEPFRHQGNRLSEKVREE